MRYRSLLYLLSASRLRVTLDDTLFMYETTPKQWYVTNISVNQDINSAYSVMVCQLESEEPPCHCNCNERLFLLLKMTSRLSTQGSWKEGLCLS